MLVIEEEERSWVTEPRCAEGDGVGGGGSTENGVMDTAKSTLTLSLCICGVCETIPLNLRNEGKSCLSVIISPKLHFSA